MSNYAARISGGDNTAELQKPNKKKSI